MLPVRAVIVVLIDYSHHDAHKRRIIVFQIAHLGGIRDRILNGLLAVSVVLHLAPEHIQILLLGFL